MYLASELIYRGESQAAGYKLARGRGGGVNLDFDWIYFAYTCKQVYYIQIHTQKSKLIT